MKLTTVITISSFVQAVLFSLSANETFYFCGSFDPAANVHLSTIDPANEEKNSKCATAIFDALEKIGVPKNRYDGYLFYVFNPFNFQDFHCFWTVY